MRIVETFSPLVFPWKGAYRNSGGQLRTAGIGHSQSTSFTMTYKFPSVGKIHFKYRVSSENRYDWFTLNFDGSQIARISGTQGWTTFEKEVQPGNHTLTVSYSKDGSVDSGEDSGFITDFWIEHNMVEITNLKVDPPFTHKENVDLTFKLNSIEELSTRCRIYTDSGQQLYPDSGFSPTFVLPIDVKHTFPASKFPLGKTTIIVETVDENNQRSNYEMNSVDLMRTNTPPDVGMTLSSTVTHKDNILLDLLFTDADKDSVQFSISLNGLQKYPETGQSGLIKTPFSYTYTIRNTDLVVGENTIRVDLTDDLGVTNARSVVIKKNNHIPTISDPAVKGQMLFATLSDGDGDMMRYRVLVNNVQVHPPTVGSWTPYLQSPAEVQYKIPDEFISFGNTHKVTLEVEDDLGETTLWSDTPLIDYSGLMFMAEDGLYYSTDVGKVLKYLEVGSIVAGSTSGTFKIFLKNTVGYTINNITLTVAQIDLDPVEEVVELSETDNPFNPSAFLNIPPLDYGDSIPFYVRINTTRKAIGGGFFDIRVVGDPA
ncbi:hypothetical protein A8L34_16200 [Bacillus sp. FJAT-27264]|uniref:hypothetical protein n=1 Tax=Paenibacillus sp. (strain DSM 101736 / FJAT-27264) TaxID=1850362 RepID=UPI00080813EA|nr:hypothetical protein [Bacillus sp. FJAT-27264]OBZ11863.1 hypothetical protein A8L34_16200 [Bacillus sp. FJAT-27264]